MSDAREWLYQAWWSPGGQDAMRDALLAVLDLHHETVGLDDALRYCYDCEDRWPCSTVRAIDKALGVAICGAPWGTVTCGKPTGHAGTHWAEVPDGGIGWGYFDE